MNQKKKLLKKSSFDVIHWRSRYVDHSQKFSDWVQTLGLEQSFLGRWTFALNEKWGLRRLGVIFSFCLALSFLILFDWGYTQSVKVGEVAQSDVKSPLDFRFVDQSSTEDKRHHSELNVPPVFDYDGDIYEKVVTKLYRGFRVMRKEIRPIQWPKSEWKREEIIKDFLPNKVKFEKEVGNEIPDRHFEWLTENKFSARIENVISRALLKWSSKKIIDGQAAGLAPDEGTVLVRVLEKGHPLEEFTLTMDEVRDVKRMSEFDFVGVRGAEELNARDQKHLLEIAHRFLVPNLNYNQQETDLRRQKAREGVLPVELSVKRNQVLLTAGTVVQPIHVALVNEINRLKSNRRTDFVALTGALLLMTFLLVFFSYFRRVAKKKIDVQVKDIAAMSVVLMGNVLLAKAFLFIADAAFIIRYPHIPSTFYLYMVPAAAGSMLVGLLITSGEIVWLYTIFQAISLSLMVDFNYGYLLLTAISGIAAARGVHSCKKRNDIYWAGLRTGGVSAAVILFLTTMNPASDGLWHQLWWNILGGLAGGVLSSMVAMMVIPLLETAFNYTTDVKLLELASLNHQLMRDMIVKAPGTYHHSLIVGSMCEAAAEEIGANALLAKVMAYYHDIGKTEHAHYFIENQRPGNNPHDHISPHMSKTVLVAHVKDGAEMGYKHKLGKPIIDGILQHHGTTLISYFYNKALEKTDDDIDQVEENDFRYPGPKPQFKEAALVMLADSIEAAARSLDEPTVGRLTNLVKNIIQSKFLDGQLDECNLTLRDLSIIGEAYRRVILSVYHQRIEYPKVAR